MTMPNFFVIGAMKAGTTSLYRYLRQHPAIFMSPVKEPAFFSRETIAEWREDAGAHPVAGDLDRYQSLFAGGEDAAARGEATPYYLCDPRAPGEIARHVPDARLIAILRQPVDRAYSAYLMKRRFGSEPLEFEDALAEEPRRIEQGRGYGWHYAGLGRYGEQLERYYRGFHPSQIKIVLYDEVCRDPATVMREVFGFLGVDAAFVPDVATRHNAAYVAKYPSLHQWFVRRSPVRERAKRFLPAVARPVWNRVSRAVRARSSVVPPPLAPAVRARLTREAEAQIQAVEDVIGRNLSAWRSA
jgi:hypothetical protein